MTAISHSQVEKFLICERRWYYSYIRRLQPIGTSSVLLRGTAGHAVLERYYKEILDGGNPASALVVAKLKFDELSAKGVTGDEYGPGGTIKNLALYDLLFNWYFPHEPFVKNGYEVLAVEYSDELEYGDDSLPFVIDLLLRDPNGKIVVVDHKFSYDFLSDNDVLVQPQIKKYIGALRGKGLPADYGIYNQLRYRKIKDPTATSTLRTHEFHPNDITIWNVATEQIEAANRIAALRDLEPEEAEKRVLRVGYKKICQSCEFVTLCTDEQRGANTRILLETEFETKQHRPTTTEETKD